MSIASDGDRRGGTTDYCRNRIPLIAVCGTKVNGSVLIVDDDASCGRLLALLVRQLGHDADYVESGGKALDYLSGRRPALVILDIMMPGIDGLEVLRQVRRNPRTADVPVVIFSALADPSLLQDIRLQGANDCWVKASMNFQDLQKRLEVYLSRDPGPN